MVGIGNAIFIQLPGTSRLPVLHPGRVLGVKDENCTVKVAATNLPMHEGQDILVYFEKNREFMKQAARIESVDTDECDSTESSVVCGVDDPEMGPVISITTLGEPGSAERRETYRVSTVMMNLTTSFGAESSCPILDVSVTGFAVMSKVPYELANMADATIKIDDKNYSGKVSVQSIRDLGGGRFRYGLYGIDDARSNTSISEGLQLLSIQTQREQLRRMSGAV